MSKIFLFIAVLSVVAAVATACGEKFPEPHPAQHLELTPGSTTEYASLIKELRTAGLSAKPGEEVEQPFFSVEGRMINIDSEDVQVFQYSSAAAADAQAALVSSDGSAVGTSKPRWIGSPHFYKKRNFVVLYVGDEHTILKGLDAVLGRQFAGK